MCLDLVADVVGSQEMMERLAIPAEHRDFVARVVEGQCAVALRTLRLRI
jgi:glutathionylspermidine synthase